MNKLKGGVFQNPKSPGLVLGLTPRAKREADEVLVNLLPRAKREAKEPLMIVPPRVEREAKESLSTYYLERSERLTKCW